MTESLESQRGPYEPHEWQLLLKRSAVYAHSFQARHCGRPDRMMTTGEDILRITLSKMKAGCDGYTFKESDILFFHYLCRCCRRTVLTLHQEASQRVQGTHPPPKEDVDTPAVLTEAAAMAFLDRRQGLDLFLAFLKAKKLKGKLRAYSTGLAKYAAAQCDVDRIAKDLRVTPATVTLYRSRLRQLLEEFELSRRRPPTA